MITTPAQRDLTAFYAVNATFGTTERYRAATQAEAYYLNLQYELNGNLQPWSKHIPLDKRRPFIIEPLFKRCVHALDDFIWSGHRFPKINVTATRTDDTDANDIGPALTKEQAIALTKFIDHDQFKGPLRDAMREATRKAITTSSCLMIMGIVGGYLSVHVEAGKHCTPTFSRENPKQLESVEILYQHQKEETVFGGGIRKVMYWYRRIVDAMSDTVFVEEPVRGGVAPVWKVDSTKTVVHSLGFCPAVWVRTFPSCDDQVDGCPVIDPCLYPILDSINYTLSQRSGAINYGLEPQLVRVGVEDPEDLVKSQYKTWDLPDGGDIKFLEYQGTGIQRANEHLEDLRKLFYQAIRVVMMDPAALTGDISGRVLEIIHTPMVAVGSSLRSDLGDGAFVMLIGLALRMIMTVGARGQSVWIPGIDNVVAILLTSQLQGPWLDLPIKLEWQPFFTESASEQQVRLAMVDSANGKYITRQTAMRNVANIFNVGDVDAELEALEKADQAKAAQATALAQQNKPPAPPSDQTKQPTSSENEPPEVSLTEDE